MKWRAEPDASGLAGGLRLRGRRPALLSALFTLSACAGGQHRMVADTPVRIGRPYQVRGSTYVPHDDPAYDEIGIASYYGARGHRGTTANGERFDPRRIGAAHRTLPLPSYVEVTALATGRRIIVRINDRGPFVAGRIIDLSYGAADLLGIVRRGTARVRVRRIYPGERTRRLLRSGRPAEALANIAPAAESASPPSPVLAQPGTGGYQPDTPLQEGR